MDFSALMGLLGNQGGAAPPMQGAPQMGAPPVAQPGFGMGQQLIQGNGMPGQSQMAQPTMAPQDPSFMDRIQAMMQQGGQQPADPNNPMGGQQNQLGMMQRLMQMRQMAQQQNGMQPNGMQNQPMMQQMQHMRNQMNQTGAQQGYLAQGGGIAPQRRIVGNGY